MLMGLEPSKALDQEWQSKSNTNMFHFLLMCIIWQIKPILLYKPFQTYLGFLTLKIYCNAYMVISIITPKGIWSLPN
jgi:hypothetical protein